MTAPPPDRRVKGTLLLARIALLRSLGPGVLEGVLASLDPADAALLRASLLPSTWYPAGLLRRLESSIAERLGFGSRTELFLEIGRAAASRNLAGAQKAYVRTGDVLHLLQCAPKIYESYFNFGSRSFERLGDRAAAIRTTKPFEEATIEECIITRGWLERAISMAGGARVRVRESRCGLAGAPYCEFLCEWELAPAVSAAL